MAKTRKVLVFPGGNEIGLEIWKSLKDLKEVELYSIASNISSHAPYVYKNHFEIPDIYNPDWISELNNIIKTYNIDYVYPAHDYVIETLADNLNKIKARVVISPPETIKITSSKRATYKLFGDLLPTPRIYSNISEIKEFPVFIKPDRGYGSQGAEKIDNLGALKSALSKRDDLLIMEYLPGEEYTIDCFSSRSAGLKFCQGRKRERVRMGTSVHGILAGKKTNEIFQNYAQAISKELEFHGAWFFQMKADKNDDFKLLEINPRIAGTMALNRVRGINFPLLGIFDAEGIDIDISPLTDEVVIDRALINRYSHNFKYNKVYVDLDDCLILHGKVNTMLVKFLYQELNKGSKLILISKNLENDSDAYLRKNRLAHLFDKVIWLSEDESKADYIEPEGAIFIDDSFSQRKEVAAKHKIPTFDPSMMEMLIDWRQ